MNLTIVATTYFPPGEDGRKRRIVFKKAADSWGRLLSVAANLVVADDGSDSEHLQWVDANLNWQHGNVLFTIGKREGVGASLNRGFDLAHDLILYAVDDWALAEPFYIDPWCRLLKERNDVGVVRLGPPHPGNRLTVYAYTEDWQGWAAEVDPAYGIVVSQRPALWHRRMWERYGPFQEGVSALECETEFDERYRQQGPDLRVVLALPHPWRHLDSVILSALQPGEDS